MGGTPYKGVAEVFSTRVAGPKGERPLAPKCGQSLRGHALRDLGPRHPVNCQKSEFPT